MPPLKVRAGHVPTFSNAIKMSTSSAFHIYTPLTQANNEIRLLTLRPDLPGSELNCRLSTVSLSTNPTYEALSYVWGTSGATRQIQIKGYSHAVGANLETALQHLRHPSENRVLWIDALCIDQENIEERSSQVSKMGSIYSSAKNVILWLGRKDAEIDAGFDLLEKWISGSMEIAISERTWSGLEKIFKKSEWWTRLWVVQEAVLAKCSTLTCGDRSVDWTTLMSVLKPRLFAAGNATDRRLVNVAKYAMGLWVWQQTHDLPNSAGLERLENYIESLIPTRTCSDPRDVVYALLGFLNKEVMGEGFMVPDYGKSVGQVYMELTRHMLVFRNQLSTLCNTYFPFSERDEEGKAIPGPSWSVDWSKARAPESLINYFPPNHNVGLFYHASGRTTVGQEIFHENPNILRLRGVTFDTIISRSTSYTDLSAWQAAVRGWEPENLHQLSYPTGEDPTDAYIRTLFRDVIRQSYGMPKGRMPSSHFPRFKKHYLHWKADGDDSYFTAERPSNVDTEQISRTDFTFALGCSTIGWCFFVTKRGYFGLAPQDMRVGDEVLVVDGACTPLVVRHADGAVRNNLAFETEAEYSRVGAAYLHGVMDGEVVSDVEAGRHVKQNLLLI
ncbi:heterokaryon incompatibility protein-domain-containing protein [Rhexocercosporidium sp. MPI-PUGE-AT-0058]|nr:heterokaryon incompatibility protein-domain-containing protein [Rhexocercosporidium sp. MPI-PUGE-AT-0058]